MTSIIDNVFKGSWLQYGTDSEGCLFVEYAQGNAQEKREWFTSKKDQRAFALQMSMWLHCKPVDLDVKPEQKDKSQRDAEIIEKRKAGVSILDLKLEYGLSVCSLHRILRKTK